MTSLAALESQTRKATDECFWWGSWALNTLAPKASHQEMEAADQLRQLLHRLGSPFVQKLLRRQFRVDSVPGLCVPKPWPWGPWQHLVDPQIPQEQLLLVCNRYEHLDPQKLSHQPSGEILNLRLQSSWPSISDLHKSSSYVLCRILPCAVAMGCLMGSSELFTEASRCAGLQSWCFFQIFRVSGGAAEERRRWPVSRCPMRRPTTIRTRGALNPHTHLP